MSRSSSLSVWRVGVYLFVGYDYITSNIHFMVFGELVKSNFLTSIIE